MPQTQVRVVGSGFTTLHFRSQPIAFLDRFVDSGQTAFGGPRGSGWEAIHELGKRHATEIVTSRVIGPGTITASIRELWDQPVWKQLSGLAGANGILQVWDELAKINGDIKCQMLIKPPQGAGPKRQKIFHGCQVTGIDSGETVEIGTLSVAKNIEITYTHATHQGY